MNRVDIALHLARVQPHGTATSTASSIQEVPDMELAAVSLRDEEISFRRELYEEQSSPGRHDSVRRWEFYVVVTEGMAPQFIIMSDRTLTTEGLR